MFQRFNSGLRDALLGSRWGMVPLCLGLIAALAMVVVQFYRELAHAIPTFLTLGSSDVIVVVLKLIDLVLVGNLVMMLVIAGVAVYLPAWDEAAERRSDLSIFADFSSLKLKVMASISAIIAVHLLERLLDIDAADKNSLFWEIIGLLAIVSSGVLLALMDRIAADRH